MLFEKDGMYPVPSYSDTPRCGQLYQTIITNIADPHHVDADANPACHFDADADSDPDPTLL
jgi:hypothetical protein